MKNILMATDYSENADNALDYAIALCKEFKAKLFLFHAYHLPNTKMANADLYQDFWIFSKQNESDIRELGGIIKKDHKIPVESIACQGFAVDEINKIVKDKDIDLIIMGIKGENIYADILGSTTTAMIRKAQCPVLVIPSNAKFHGLNNIVLATDYEDVEESFDLNLPVELVKANGAILSIFNVRPSDEMLSVNLAVQGIRLGNLLRQINYSYDFVEDDNIIDGIGKYIKSKNADIIIMLSRKHSLIDRLFKTSFTKTMTLKTAIPLLALPELK